MATTPKKKQMNWDAQADLRLFLTIINTHDIKVDTAKAATGWNNNYGGELTANAIAMRMKKLKAMAGISGGNKGTASANSSPVKQSTNGSPLKQSSKSKPSTPSKKAGDVAAGGGKPPRTPGSNKRRRHDSMSEGDDSEGGGISEIVTPRAKAQRRGKVAVDYAKLNGGDETSDGDGIVVGGKREDEEMDGMSDVSDFRAEG